MKTTPIQTSFSAGEITPLMYNRGDTEGYAQGVKQMLNMIPDSRGPARGRAGSRFITSVDGDDVRLMTFQLSENDYFNVVFSHQKITISTLGDQDIYVPLNDNISFNYGGQGWVTEPNSPPDPPNPPESAVRFEYNYCVLSTGDTPNADVYVSQQVTVPQTGFYRLSYRFNGTHPAKVRVGTTKDSGNFFDSSVSDDEDAVINATATTFWITFKLESALDDPKEVFLDTFSLTEITPSSVIEIDTVFNEEDLKDIQYISDPSGKAVYVLHELRPTHKFVLSTDVEAIEFDEVNFANPPPQWETRNYPSTGDFFEGRLWLGGTRIQPQTFWGSKSGDNENFKLGVNDDDAIVFTLAKYGRIRWMVGFKKLMIGTSYGEFIVSSGGGLITPSDVQVDQQSSYGSVNIRPVQVGDQVFYVSADRVKIRAVQYNWQEDNWISNDLTFNSEHITKARIKHIIWQQNPNNVLLAVLEDGNMAMLVYDRTNNVYGWSRYETNGDVKDISVGSIEGIDLANLAVQRREGTIFLETQLMDERLVTLQPEPRITEANERAYVDSWEMSEPIDGVVSNLEHLEGMECQIILDGAVHPERVVENGQIQLQRDGEIAIVGLAYVSRLETLPPDFGSSTGSATPHIKRWNKIFVRILSSGKPTINGHRPPSRHPSTPMDTAEPNKTEDVMVNQVGHSLAPTVLIEQDLPLPFTVLGIFGELNQSII